MVATELAPRSFLSVDTCTWRLFSSTTRPGQTRSRSSLLLTTRSRWSMRARRRSNARAPTAAGWPWTSSWRSAGRTSTVPNRYVVANRLSVAREDRESCTDVTPGASVSERLRAAKGHLGRRGREFASRRRLREHPPNPKEKCHVEEHAQESRPRRPLCLRRVLGPRPRRRRRRRGLH